MRWEGLFADLEAQMGREIALEEDAVNADERRHELGQRTLLQRIASMGEGGACTLILIGDMTHRIVIENVGADWIAGREVDSGRPLLIPACAIVAVTSRNRIVDAASISPSRLQLRMLLRDLARRRSAVTLSIAGRPSHGTIDVVGKDYLELASHPGGTARRRDEVTATELVPLASLASLTY